MNFQDIYQYFQDPPPVYLSKEVAVCFILSVLVEHGDSYGTALIHLVEAEHPLYRLSDTVLYGALKFLEQEDVIQGYWQKVEGRGRPRRMYRVAEDKLDKAMSLGRLWHKYIGDEDLLKPSSHLQSG